MALPLLVVGCVGPAMQVDGFALNAAAWSNDSQQLQSRASFNLNCPAKDLRLKVLAISPGYTDHDFAQTVGVEGCNRRATYVRPTPYVAWVMNSTAGTADEKPKAN